MSESDSEFLRRFLADEAAALAEDRQGLFYPRNHHKIAPLVPKAAKLLEPDQREALYFHMMRHNGDVLQVNDVELPLLIRAYRRLLPDIDAARVAWLASRLVLLFVLGFDESGALPSGETRTAKELKARMAVIRQVGNYTSMPGQRDKKARFMRFASEAPRILECLRHLRYRHDRRYPDDESLYRITSLTFWGMVFICLLNRDTRTGLVSDMLDGSVDLVRSREQIGMLDKYIKVVLPDVDPSETQFLSLARQVAAQETERRRETESWAWARELGLPFDVDEDWQVSISLRRGRDQGARDMVWMRIAAHPDWQWEVNLHLESGEKYQEAPPHVWHNDLGLPVIGAGNIGRFPQWLARLRAEHGLDFDIAGADVYAGRKRQAVKLIRQWLAGA